MFNINLGRVLASAKRLFSRNSVQGVRLSVPERRLPEPGAGSLHPVINVTSRRISAEASQLNVEVMCLLSAVRDLDIRLEFTPDQGLDTGLRSSGEAGEILDFSFELPSSIQPCQLRVLVSYITQDSTRRTWEFSRRVMHDELGGLRFLPVDS